MHAFVVAPGTRRERMAAAVTDVGASVLSGITLTKFVGMHSACTGVPDIAWIRITDINQKVWDVSAHALPCCMSFLKDSPEIEGSEPLVPCHRIA